MRIAYFTDTFYPQINGVSNTLDYLGKYLDKNGVDHMVFAPDYDGEADENAGPSLVRFKGLRPLIYPECRLAFPAFAEVLAALADFRPDVVHIATELGVGFAGLRAARALKLPVVMSYHTNFDAYLDFYGLQYLSRPLWAYMKWFHRYALVNLCPSLDTMRGLEGHGFSNLALWPRGVDLRRFSPGHYSEAVRKNLGGQGKTIFLYVGRIAREKELDTLVRSIRIVNKRHLGNTLFVFTGDGPYLEDLISEKLPNAVFTGPKQGRELSALYASADAFLFPSGTETFGNAALEAMASGLPVVCVDSGGVRDYTRHGVSALVCRRGDASSLARGITDMLSPLLREKIRLGALETARARSWEAVFDHLFMHYEAAAGKTLHQLQNIAV